tara:strand:+ start:7022 stop:7870 length:849 start_codon:yes stop_codon:yes gene_type:complete
MSSEINIINDEKLNIYDININLINNIFINNFFKYMFYLKKKFLFQNEINFNSEIESISNMLFHISWTILLSCYNIKITIFFMERAAILFGEFIIISSQTPNYIVHSTSKLNDAIIFTYKKTIGNTNIDNILKMNLNYSAKNNNFYNIRKSSFLNKIIINSILKDDNINNIENNFKILVPIFESIYNIYQTIDIDNFLFCRINKFILEEKNLDKSINLIKIYLIIIDIYLQQYFSHNLDKEIELFLDHLENKIIFYFKNKDYKNLYNKEIHNFKNIVFRFLEL